MTAASGRGVRRRTVALGAAAALVAAGAGTGVAVGSLTDDGGERLVRGPQARQAVAAALAVTGGGTANAVERDREDGAVWEVEVTRPDGVTVDVRLDSAFRVVVVETDGEQRDSRRED